MAKAASPAPPGLVPALGIFPGEGRSPSHLGRAELDPQGPLGRLDGLAVFQGRVFLDPKGMVSPAKEISISAAGAAWAFWSASTSTGS